MPNWKTDYYDPYAENHNSFRKSKSPNNKYLYPVSREKQEYIVSPSGRVYRIKSQQKNKKLSSQQKYNVYVLKNRENDETADRNFIKRQVQEQLKYSNRKSPIKIIKKSVSKQRGTNKIFTSVEAPSSIASSVLGNFDSNPSRLLKNMTDSAVDKVFKHH